MKQFKYNWLGNDLVCIAVWGGEYFDENAEKREEASCKCEWKSQKHANDMHSQKPARMQKGRDILCMEAETENPGMCQLTHFLIIVKFGQWVPEANISTVQYCAKVLRRGLFIYIVLQGRSLYCIF